MVHFRDVFVYRAAGLQHIQTYDVSKVRFDLA